MITRIRAGTYSADKITAIIAQCALMAMMLLTVADVVGRYFFSSPIKGTFELVGLSLVCAGTWGWGYCQMRKGHVSVSLLTDHFSPMAKSALVVVAYLIGLAGFSLLCWRAFALAWRYIFLPRGGVTETLGTPYFPFMLALAISAGLMALTLLIELLYSFAEARQK